MRVDYMYSYKTLYVIPTLDLLYSKDYNIIV